MGSPSPDKQWAAGGIGSLVPTESANAARLQEEATGVSGGTFIIFYRSLFCRPLDDAN
jgi:hypothetical protein